MSTPPPLPDDPFITTGAPPVAEGGYQMAPVSDDVSAQPKPTACVACGAAEFSTRTEMPVCEPCRTGLVRFPFPRWVKASAAVVVVLVLVSLAFSSERAQGAYHYTRAKKMVEQQRWEEAYQSYHKLVINHSDTETLIMYAETAMKSGHHADAATALSSLQGRYVLDHQKHRAETVVDELERLAGQQEKEESKPKVKIPFRPQ